jgi:HK97 family phage major capsid protein
MANLGQGENSLYKVLDVVERIKDQVESIDKERGALIESKTQEIKAQARELGEANAALQAEVEQLKADRDAARTADTEKMEEIEARCNKLDEMLPRGEKVFTSGVRSKDADLAAFGRAFTVARRAANGDALPSDYARANLEGEKTITSNTVGGTLVPVETHSSAIRIIGEKSLARNIARQVPMGSDRMILPIQSGKPTVYWPSEGAAASDESTVNFEDATKSDLIAKTLTAYDGISRELDEDSLVALEPFFAEVFGDAIAQEENKQLLVGQVAADGGSDPFKGIDTAPWVNDNNAAAGYTVTYPQLVDTMYGVGGDSINGGSWVMNSDMLGEIVSLVGANGSPIFSSAWGQGGISGPGAVTPNQSTGLAGFLLGKPVYTSNVMKGSPISGTNNTLLIYGNFDYAFFGDRRALSVEFDDSVFFRERKRCMLAYERVSVLIHSQENNKTFSKLTNES